MGLDKHEEVKEMDLSEKRAKGGDIEVQSNFETFLTVTTPYVNSKMMTLGDLWKSFE
jgi:hypothetical protein